MNKNILLALLVTILVGCKTEEKAFNVDDVFQATAQQLKYQLDISDSLRTETHTSPRTIEEGNIRMSRMVEWTSGFFPGILWEMYEITADETWRLRAEDYTAKITPMQYNERTHDIGFMMYCSFGRGYQMVPNDTYKEVLLQSATTLMTRYSPTVGCIRSWDHAKDKWDYPVIIDNMMNLELLYWATKVTGDNSFAEVANKHAMTTLENHFRKDNSCYHVIDYNPETGAVQKRNTAQGFADESAWSRGQAWALYGYTMCYRETGIPVYLEQAQRVAEYIINHPETPDDLIPYWDYDAPNKATQPRDASAAAVIASALIELSDYVDHKNEYFNYAETILTNLSSAPYLAEVGSNWGFILKHSTGSIPHGNEVDEPLVYADYYFLEALLRFKAKK